ncbi:MAG TPA: GTP cyclohydrolase I FolE [Microbacteriaceae bacterium]|nr:GTP cyclohydrolase I FolE [Microbacteriaceae bacterium]
MSSTITIDEEDAALQTMTGQAPSPRQHAEVSDGSMRQVTPTIDRVAAQAAVADLLRALGRDPEKESLADTPRRVADAYRELLTPVPFKATTFPNDEHYDELVLVKDIPFHSLCEHHLLPFYGVAHIAYLPADRIVGLSKLPRMLEYCARDLQVQERLTVQVADWLDAILEPQAVGVVLEAEHECMRLRGVKTAGARTRTVAVRGLLKTDRALRREFLDRL